MAERSNPPAVPCSLPFSFPIPRPQLPTAEWLEGNAFWGVNHIRDFRSGLGSESQPKTVAEPGPVDEDRSGPGFGAVQGTNFKQEVHSHGTMLGSLPQSMGGRAASRPTSSRTPVLKQPCLRISEMGNPIGARNVPVATSEKWQDRVEGEIRANMSDCTASFGFVHGTREGTSRILFRKQSGEVGNDDEANSIDRGHVPEGVNKIHQVRTLQFDLNCMPDELSNVEMKSDNKCVTKTCNKGERPGLDLMQFVDSSIEETSSWYSFSDTEDQGSTDENVHDNVDVASPLGGVSGMGSGNSVNAYNISEACSTGSTNCNEKGDEVNGPRSKRHYRVEGPNARDKQEGKKSALEMAIMKFADRSTPYIIDPSIGTEFDCVAEAFDYYNLYSWEAGFGIKYGRTRYSESKKLKDINPAEKYVLSVEMRCCCAGVPDKNQRVSGKLGCRAMIRLHRTQDHGYVVFTRDLSMGGPLISQAAKIYTYKVFGMFCKVKTESEDYFVTEVVKGKEYIAEHYNVEKVQRWCKGRYLVQVNADCTMFKCECGMFEHFGLPCCHSLRVMISVGVKAIPDAMIMRRWTRKARVILPAHLAQYGDPNPALTAQTYRHAALFLAALELVKLGDSNVKCFHILMACFAAAKEKLSEASKIKDGLGLEEREAAKENIAPENLGDQAEDVLGERNDLFPLRAPKRKRERGRPTNAREKPAYENLSKRPKFCKTCKAADHRSDRCPLRDRTLDRPRAPPTCRRCGLQGHTVTNCGTEKQVAAMAAAI
ncbi:hypothetical protein EJB05_02291, partial [Eragrostis curvula]